MGCVYIYIYISKKNMEDNNYAITIGGKANAEALASNAGQ